jgi:hypothetical protein
MKKAPPACVQGNYHPVHLLHMWWAIVNQHPGMHHHVWMDVARTVLTLFFIRFLFPANLPIVEGVGLLESRSVPGVLELRFIQLDGLKTETTGCGAFVGAWSRPCKVQACWETMLVSWYVTNFGLQETKTDACLVGRA